MSLRSEMILDAKLIMRDGLLRENPTTAMDDRGYVEDWRSNLLSGIDARKIAADLGAGKGGELASKFRAAHSSAALAVNAFGPFRDGEMVVPMPYVGNVKIEQFECTFPTGVAGGTPPHLDVAARGENGVVAIESKCLEYLTPKAAEFSSAYQKLTRLSSTGWFKEMERLRDDPRSYEALDAAQLVKHAFGLMNSAGEGATLVYLFWEPFDANGHYFFRRHRDEIAWFSERVHGDELRFVSLSYLDLWKAWENSGEDNLVKHADRLRSRYGGSLGSYEGYTRVNGRKTDAGFFDDID